MNSFRSKPIGWKNDNYRHYLAAKYGTAGKTYFAMSREQELRARLHVLDERRKLLHETRMGLEEVRPEVQNLRRDIYKEEGGMILAGEGLAATGVLVGSKPSTMTVMPPNPSFIATVSPGPNGTELLTATGSGTATLDMAAGGGELLTATANPVYPVVVHGGESVVPTMGAVGATSAFTGAALATRVDKDDADANKWWVARERAASKKKMYAASKEEKYYEPEEEKGFYGTESLVEATLLKPFEAGKDSFKTIKEWERSDDPKTVSESRARVAAESDQMARELMAGQRVGNEEQHIWEERRRQKMMSMEPDAARQWARSEKIALINRQRVQEGMEPI